jgi:prefoldin subunit 5
MKNIFAGVGILSLIAIVIIAIMAVFVPVRGEVYSEISAPLTYADSSKVSIEMPASAPMGVDVQDVARSAGGAEVANSTSGADRLVIKNADLSVVVKDPETKMTAIAAMAERLGGFVVSSSMYETYINNGVSVPEGSIVIRVPAAKLNDVLKEIKEGVVEVQSESSNGQDITQAYTDLQSNLKNLEAAEKQLQDIMAKAETTEDVINVFNQLTYYRQQIEMVKGQIKYYDESVALSAVSVRLIAEETVKPLELAGWKPEGIARDALQSLINFWQGFLSFLIWLGVFGLPALLIISVPVGLIWWGVNKWKAKRKAG